MLGKNVRMYREERGISQREMAKICELPRTTYRDIEDGKIRNPTLNNICKLCKGFGISPNELIPRKYWKE